MPATGASVHVAARSANGARERSRVNMGVSWLLCAWTALWCRHPVTLGRDPIIDQINPYAGFP
jgi:hypothetical protein